MMIAGLLFTAMVGAVKVARQELSALEVMTFRCAVSLPVAYLLARRNGLLAERKGMMLLRGVLGSCAMLCFFTAAHTISLGDLSIIAKLQPILVALFAPLLLGADEKSDARVWFTLFAGLLGAALIIGPDLQLGSVASLWAVAASLFSALAHVVVRSLSRTERPAAIVFWFQVTTLVLSFTAFVLMEGRAMPMPPSHLYWALGTTGLCATLGQFAMTAAYREDRASVVAAASYTQPVFAFGADLILFGTSPTVGALVGGTIVIGAGLMLVRKEPEKGVETARPEPDAPSTSAG